MHTLSKLLAGLLLLSTLLCVASRAEAAPAPAPATAVADEAAAPGAAPPRRSETTAADKLRLLSDLVADPEIRRLLDQRKASPGGPDGGLQAGPRSMPASMAGGLGDNLQQLRNRLRALAEAVPLLPAQVEHARSMLTDMLGRSDAASLAFFLPVFVLLGFGGEAVFRLANRRSHRWLLGLHLDTVGRRVTAVLARLAYGLGLVASYALGSIGAFLPFDWTLRFKQVLLALLLVSLATRLAAVFGRFLLAPGAPRFRVLPVGTPAAAFLFRRAVALGLLLGIGSQSITLMAAFGFDQISQDLVAYALGIVLLALGVEVVWRCPRTSLLLPGDGPVLAPPAPVLPADDVPADAIEVPHEVAARHADWHRYRRTGGRIGLTVVFLLLWCFWVAGTAEPFWLLAFGVGLPATVALTQLSIRHVLRPTQTEAALDAARLEVILLERGIRTLMIAGGVFLLAHVIGLDVAYLTMQDTVSTRATRAVLGVLVVALVADFLWRVIVAVIDRKLAGTLGAGDQADTGSHQARLQTLLPITKNLSLAVLAVITAMMLLAALGVEIGPLIASAGVVGVAIGFGAQTLVKDIISGIFYLVDDAFRIGEYIQSGTYKGTVESFSLRSVKLRHQRGALYTIPFGTLGAVQNLSRDWVVDKIKINVPYDTDLEVVRKIVKRIGTTLLEDPEFGHDIIKPIKLQGVSQFGDYALQLQTKMMTKPGDVQFAARRRALLLIKDAFKASGIGFALPTVQVSGEGSDAAGAHHALALVAGGQASAAE